MNINIVKKENGIEEIIIQNNMGFLVSFLNLGATIKDIHTKDKYGRFESVVMHPIDTNEYINSSSYYGKTIGRTSGRIEYAKFKLNDKEYHLDLNDNDHNCLHGGKNGLSELFFNYEINQKENQTDIIFKTTSNEDGYPGTLNVTVIYSIYEEQQILDIIYKATSNEDTLLNMTNHAYFNLSGNGRNNILEHTLQMNASRYTHLDNYLITLAVEKVNETMDFRQPKLLKANMFDSYLKDHAAYGYDHYFLFDDVDFNKPNVILEDKNSGRKLEVHTTYPGTVIYTCNYPRGEEVHPYRMISLHDSICIECQFIPNAINMQEYREDTILIKNKEYNNKISFIFK